MNSEAIPVSSWYNLEGPNTASFGNLGTEAILYGVGTQPCMPYANCQVSNSMVFRFHTPAPCDERGN